MRTSSENRRETGSAVLIVVLICTMVFAARIVLGSVYFETNDDETLNLIAAGAYGPQSVLIYQNILLGWLYRMLYALVPSLNWYLVFMLAANFAAVTTLCLVFTGKKDMLTSLLITMAVCMSLGSLFFNELQYTKNGALYTAVGFVILGRTVREERRSRAALAAAALFILLGFLVRRDSFLSVCPFGLVYLAASLLFASGGNPGQAAVLLRRKCMYLLLPFFLTAVAFSVDRLVTRADPAWKEYLEFNEYRTQLLDYGMPDFKKHEEEIRALGFDENDLHLLRSWMYADPDVYTTEKLRSLVEIRDRDGRNSIRFNRTVVHEACRRMMSAIRAHSLPVLFLAVFVVSIILLDTKGIMMMIVLALGVCGEYWYLTCMNRVEWRAECGIWLAPLLMGAAALLAGYGNGAGLFVVLKGETRRRTRSRTAAVVCAGLLLGGIFAGDLLHNFFIDKQARIVTSNGKDFMAFFREINEREDGMYLFDTLTFSSRTVEPDLPSMNAAVMKNLYRNAGFLGGWIGGSPTGQYFAAQRGIDNPAAALLQEGVFLADNTGLNEKLLLYLREHYDPQADMQELESIDGIRIWKYMPGKA